MTAAAITRNSSSEPMSLVWLARRACATIAEIAQRTPIRVKIFTVSIRVLMPDSSAASGLPPAAKM